MSRNADRSQSRPGRFDPSGGDAGELPAEFTAIYRREYGRCTATLVRAVGDIDLAEEAVADAFAVAVRRWPDEGIPPNPGAWITTTARRAAIDRWRRESSRHDREREAVDLIDSRHVHSGSDSGVLDDAVGLLPVDDDQLRLILLCCHPALGPDAQVALTLRLLGGLTTSEIAKAFLVPDSTIGQRVTRAKRKIRATTIPYRLPAPENLAERLVPVLATIYLIYTEGHTATAGAALQRPALTEEAIRIARLVAGLLGDHPEAIGLLALTILTEARAPARLDTDGELVRLAEQDRTLWDHDLISEGLGLVRRCLDINRPGPYQLQAAIAAVHADAPSAAATDWAQIVTLYDHLYQLQPDPIIALNRAIAVMEERGPVAALEALDEIDLATYNLFHAARAEALQRLDRQHDSAAAIRRALALTTNATQRRHLQSQLLALGWATDG